MAEQIRISFEPYKRTVFVLAGTSLIEAAARAGLTIETPCGGAGTCGKCRVKITSGTREPTETEKSVFDEKELLDGWRLACQYSLDCDTAVYLPETSRLAGSHKIVTESSSKKPQDCQPCVRKIYVKLPAPTMKDNTADMLRLEKATAGDFKTDLKQLRNLPKLLREYDYKGTAVLSENHLIAFEPGNTTDNCYGAAFDIGTTTIVGSLVNLGDGSELAVSSQINPQVSYGDDVLSRIRHSATCDNCLDELSGTVKTAVGTIIDNLCEQAGIDHRQIYEVVFAGNTTMEHLLCSIDPAPLGQIPFVPAYAKGLMLDAEELEISINRHGKAYVFPIIGGFVGGDTVAGILAADISDGQGPVLMIDIGTNGEIVLAKDGQLWAASTAAGPAFEGARINCGMRAAAGAIEKIVFDGDIRCSVIGNVPAVGMCGSALIDLLAEMLEAKMITPTGQLLASDKLPKQLPAAIRQRVYQNNDGQTEFLVSQPDENLGNSRIVLTQRDIREVQLAVGAIRAGIKIMLKNAGVDIKDIKRVLIAGGFGSFIRRNNAQRIGLLPAKIEHEKISYIGNASLAGARLALLCSDIRKLAEKTARKTKHIELSIDSNFQTEFANAMIFPDTVQT